VEVIPSPDDRTSLREEFPMPSFKTLATSAAVAMVVVFAYHKYAAKA